MSLREKALDSLLFKFPYFCISPARAENSFSNGNYVFLFLFLAEFLCNISFDVVMMMRVCYAETIFFLVQKLKERAFKIVVYHLLFFICNVHKIPCHVSDVCRLWTQKLRHLIGTFQSSKSRVLLFLCRGLMPDKLL